MEKKKIKRIIGWLLIFLIVGGYFTWLGKDVSELFEISWFLGVLLATGILVGCVMGTITIGFFIAWLLLSN